MSNPWLKAPCGDGGEGRKAGAYRQEEKTLSIPCEIIRSDRRTLSIQVEKDGRVLLRIPARVSDKEALEFAARHDEWIAVHYRRALENRESRRVYSDAEIEEYKKNLRPVLEHRAAYYARLMGVTYGRISIRAQKTRWGSCSGSGNLNFNWKLALLPPEVSDYVIVHELAHRREMNHSDRFWEQVERILPDYRERRRWLKENGSCL